MEGMHPLLITQLLILLAVVYSPCWRVGFSCL